MNDLQNWYAELPPHLRDFNQVAGFHKRSVAVLHLRYWRTVMFATRPFKLYNVSREGRKLADATKQKWFDDFGTMCLGAAQKAMEAIAFLRDHDLLTSRIPFDCTSILECMQVSLLALIETNAAEQLENVKTCTRTLQGMEQILWTKHALTEVMAQLEEHGIWDGENVLYPASMETPNLMFLDIVPNNEL